MGPSFFIFGMSIKADKLAEDPHLVELFENVVEINQNVVE
jgi:hypothetical protein